MSNVSKDNVVVRNIYYMLAYAYRALSISEYSRIETESFENVDDLLAAILAAGLSAQRRRGFERNYLELEEDVAGAKGRILPNGTAQHQARRSLKTHCAYDEFSEDTYKNRILKTTALAMLRCDDVRQGVKADLKRSLLLMRDIEVLDTRNIDWSRISYHRNNRSYQLLIGVCYLVLHHLLPTQDEGKTNFASFIDAQELHALYEQFVLRYYEKHHPELQVGAKIINRKISANAPSFIPNLCTDITLSNKNRTLIIDTKCYGKILKTYHDKEMLSPANLNQIYSYTSHEQYKNPKHVEGMLLYALTDRDNVEDTSWVEAGVPLHFRTLDLSLPFSGIVEQLESIAQIVA